jgi:hypothetical protein
MVLGGVMSCLLADSYQCSGQTCSHHLQCISYVLYLKSDAAASSETSANARHHIPKDAALSIHRHDGLEFHIILDLLSVVNHVHYYLSVKFCHCLKQMSQCLLH